MNHLDLKLSVKSISDIIRCANLASMLEVSGWPKPGNVHRTKNFKQTKYEHFLAGIAAIQPNIGDLCERAYNNIESLDENFSTVGLGPFFFHAAKAMMQWQAGGNVLLGHILLFGPLCASSSICLRLKIISFNGFVRVLQKVIKDATVNDTIYLYKAINFCNPGGMGKIEKYDLNDPKFEEDLRNDNITLKEIFSFSKSYDLISLEYDSGFSIILHEVLPHFFEYYKQENDINKAIVNSFLYILSRYPDSLIVRKAGEEEANRITHIVKKIIQNGGVFSKSGFDQVKRLDEELHRENGKLNPGTTADLTAGVIFSALLFGLKF